MTQNAHITLSISKKLYEEMKKHREINWSEIARKSIEEKLSELKEVTDGREIVEKLDPETKKILDEISKLSKKDWINYYRKVREKEWKRTKSLIRAY